MTETMSIKQRWKSLRNKILPRVDPEIRDLIAELNDKGYYTIDSCAGHMGGGNSEGIIFFSIRYAKDEDKIIRIMKKHGLKNVTKSNSYSTRSKCFVFDPMAKGKSQAEKRFAAGGRK